MEYEKFDNYKYIDISIPEAMIDIEVDGVQHNLDTEQAFADLKRTYYSFKNDSYITLRIPNVLTRDKIIEETAQFIDKFLKKRMQLDNIDR